LEWKSKLTPVQERNLRVLLGLLDDLEKESS